VKQGIDEGDIRARIEFVFCNRERGQTEQTDLFLDQVESYAMPLVCLSSRRFKQEHGVASIDECRVEFDREAMRLLGNFSPDICVLAGYMLIVGEEMCSHFDMINLHPALPGGPKGTWREVIWELIETGADETGAMMHLVTPELDMGPPVTFCAFPIRGGPYDSLWAAIEDSSVQEVKTRQGEDNPLFKLIRYEGVRREQPLVVATLKAFSEGKVRIEDGNLVDAGGHPIRAYSLTEEIKGMLKSDSPD
jgi:folate-dependent phosphoribosylglycinamide formyltransferase PurN